MEKRERVQLSISSGPRRKNQRNSKTGIYVHHGSLVKDIDNNLQRVAGHNNLHTKDTKSKVPKLEHLIKNLESENKTKSYNLELHKNSVQKFKSSFINQYYY